MSSAGWRIGFAVAGVFIAAGGVMHPRGATMAAMLADPNWLASHVLQLVGYAALVAGFRVIQRGGGLAGSGGRALSAARILFPGVILLAIWLILTAVIQRSPAGPIASRTAAGAG